jgi:hypothetical protein
MEKEGTGRRGGEERGMKEGERGEMKGRKDGGRK